MKFVVWLDEITNKDVHIAGGKGASLGEMWNAGLPVPDAFIVTADAYRYFITETGIKEKIKELLKDLNIRDTKALEETSKKIRELMESVEMPYDLKLAIVESYNKLCEKFGEEVPVAVRSSATAEDLPDASFAGQQDTYLNVKGADNVVKYVQKCFSSLFTPRAIFYREEKGFDHFDVAIAVVVQKLVNADKAGVMFTVNPINQNYDELVIEAAWGLGEGVVSGTVSPDTYIVDKKTLEIKDKHIARKEKMFIKDEKGETKLVDVPEDLKEKQVLTDEQIKEVAKVGIKIEEHYKRPMDVEWAYEKDKLYMLQARPITTLKKGKKEEKSEEVDEGKIILKGIGASPGIASGKVKIVMDIKDIDKVEDGDVLVAPMTTPDMVPAMKKASAIVTDEGGLTCIEGDAKILTNRGFLKMKDVYELVKNGEKLMVLGLNAQTLKTEWKEIIDAQKREAKRYEIGVYRKAKDTKDTIKITPDHKFPVFVDGELSKVQLSDIIDNNLSVLSIDYIPMIEEKYECLSKVMYLSGAILSDGHIIRKNGKPIRVRFTQKNVESKKEFIEKVKKDIELIGGKLSEIGNRNNVIEFQTSRKKPSEILGFIEDNINTIPLYATKDEISDLIAGFVDGDGCLSGKRRIEIYQNSSHIKKIEGLIVGLYRLGIIPRLRYKKSTAVIYFNNNLETILQRTRRIKLDKLMEFKEPVEDKKLIDISQILPEIKEFDYRGYLYKSYKEKLFVGINKIEKYINNINKEGIEKIRQKIKVLKESDIYSIRIKKIGEDYGEVYNITVKAEDEFNHNYIVWTKYYTPIVVFNCHAAIVSRELGIPCVVGTKKATKVLREGQIVTVDGEKGLVYEGIIKKKEEEKKVEEVKEVILAPPIITATEVKVNVSMPEVAERAAKTGADGVGLLRAEHMILGLGKHPKKILEEEGKEALINALMEGIRKVADAFYPRPVTYRTLDAPTDEFRGLEGGEREPIEHNPMLGWRGIRRGLDEVEILKCELEAIKRLREEGYKNIEIMIPLVTHPDEVKRVKEIAREVGLELRKDVPFGIMVETPAAALIIEDFIKEGIDFVSLGTNDLTQYTIAIDRNNELVSKYYKEDHPAVLKLVENVIKTCKKHNVKVSICGQAGSRPHIVEKLVEWGIDAVSANIDAVDTIRRVVARTEQKVILNFIRRKSLEE